MDIHTRGLKLDEAVDSAMQEYADQETKALQDWKESAMTVMNAIDLQECGKLLKVPLGASVSEYILPAIKENQILRTQIEKLKSLLEDIWWEQGNRDDSGQQIQWNKFKNDNNL